MTTNQISPPNCPCYSTPLPPGVKRAKCKLCGRVVAPAGHTCHAKGCSIEVPPAMLMCRTHWYMVPAPLRRRVWATYRKGQEIDKSPSAEYLKAADDAIEAVARKEGLLPNDEQQNRSLGSDKP